MKSLKITMAALFFAGMYGAFATCTGTLHFKKPDEWPNTFYVTSNNVSTLVPATSKNAATGYYDYDLSKMGSEYQETDFGLANSKTTPVDYVLAAQWNGRSLYDPNVANNNRDIACPNSKGTTDVWVMENPKNPGQTLVSYTEPNFKYFYVLPPDEGGWLQDALMISYTDSDGVKKDTVMFISQDYCGWYYMVFDAAPKDAVIYLKHSPDVQLGINGLWGADDIADPIALDLLFEVYGSNELFFIPDDSNWPDYDSQGWYMVFPEVEGSCMFSLATVIYDTDGSLLEVFTHDPDVSGYGACVGVHTGIVKTELGLDGKPQYSGSANAMRCFGTETNFSKLFNYTPGVNEVQCYDMPFSHYGRDTRWEFNSDYMVTDGLKGGFFPLENSTDANVVALNINGVQTLAGPTPASRSKSSVYAPVPLLSSVKDFDHYCNTPGWFGGVDCGADNLFNNGESPAVWDWGNREEWTDVQRNQHFCMQSHATFTYAEDQEFTIIGDDDIWVFINGKLAIDNGGAHLPAPGHVVLKNLNTTYGANFLVPGMDYPIDIFVCDRRTGMSNLNIKTNMYIRQTTGIDLATSRNSAGGLVMDICVENSGGGDCAAVALGSTGQEKTRRCSEEIDATITYSITTRKGEIPAGCADCSVLPIGMVVHGGIDLTNAKVPVIYPDRISGLAPGSYRLYIEVNGKKSYFPFTVKGNLGIVSQDVVFENIDNEVSAYPSGTRWKFASSGMAGTRVPVYISAPDDQGGVDLISAPGQTYTLNVSAGVALYATNDPADVTPLPSPYSGKVNETGIDTLWVEVPLAGMASSSFPVTASVGNTSATITFYLPQLTFARPATKDASGNVLTWNPITQDPDENSKGEKFYHKLGSDVDYNVIVINPVTGALCTECSFPIDVLDASNGINSQIAMFDKGVYLVRIRSNKEYVENVASMVVGSIENNAIAAPYGNMHFVDADEAQDDWGDVEQSGEEIGTEPSEDNGSEGDSGKAGSSSSKGVNSSSSHAGYSDDGVEFASPSFHIEMTGPFEFKIVMNEDVSDIKKSYAVMDLQGRVLLQGSIDAQETLVPALSKGSYIVKVGLGHRRVNIR